MLIDIIQIITALLLITVVLLQNRGAGLSATFGGEGNVFRTKRGIERSLFIFTIILSIIFLGTALVNVIY